MQSTKRHGVTLWKTDKEIYQYETPLLHGLHSHSEDSTRPLRAFSETHQRAEDQISRPLAVLTSTPLNICGISVGVLFVPK